MPIYVLCDYYIYKTDFADLSSFKQNLENSRQIPKFLLLLESGNLQVEQTKFPVIWPNFQIPCVFFPDRDFFCGYPGHGKEAH